MRWGFYGIGKLLLVTGALLLLVGGLLMLLDKLNLACPFKNLFRLPGDIVIKRKGLTVFIPLTSSLILSLLLTLVLNLVLFLLFLFRR